MHTCVPHEPIGADAHLQQSKPKNEIKGGKKSELTLYHITSITERL